MFLHTAWCRTFQFFLRYGAKILPWRIPNTIEGENAILQLAAIIKQEDLRRILFVTDPGIAKIGLAHPLLASLAENNIAVAGYSNTCANPTIQNIEDALLVYNTNNCEGIIAFGGGSAIDCAKGVAARVARPNKFVPQMKGLLKIRHKTPLLFAVPTTSGTGSEATIAAVVTNQSTHEKYPINDTVLIPSYAILDPLLTKGLPPFFTATTGMDALTHCVEALIGSSNTALTRQSGEEAIILIFTNLHAAYVDGENLVARANMQKAAFLAGVAFTRAYVGNVHAIAHTLGGFYSIPHGLANAILLPVILEYYAHSAHKQLAKLADLVNLGSPNEPNSVRANYFIQAIRQMNQSMDIPTCIPEIQDKDIPFMVENAFHEANPLYPVPKIFTRKDFHAIYKMVQTGSNLNH